MQRNRALLVTLACLFALLGAGIHDGDARLVKHRCSTQYLHRGDNGPCVKAASYLLTAEGKPARKELRQNPYFHFRKTSLTSHFGRGMVRDTVRAKYRLGYPRNEINGVWGPNLWAYIVGSKLIPIKWRVTAGKRYQRHIHPPPKPVTRRLATLVRDANYLISQASRIHYSQGDRRMAVIINHSHLPPLGYSLYTDCSASVTVLYWLAGLPDPNGFGFNGYGYTGTIARHGRVVWRIGQSMTRLRVGDLLLYGRPPFDHVTMVISTRPLRVFSHGSEAGPLRLPPLYRFDLYEARRFV